MAYTCAGVLQGNHAAAQKRRSILILSSSTHTNSERVPHVRTSVRGSIKTGRSPIKGLSFHWFCRPPINYGLNRLCFVSGHDFSRAVNDGTIRRALAPATPAPTSLLPSREFLGGL